MAGNDWFVDWFNSPFYKKLYNAVEAPVQEALLQKIISRLALKPRDRVLELGCREGENSAFLAAAGMDVTGVDPAPAVIEAAISRQTQNLHFFVHDMRLPFWGNYFDAAINLFTRFGFYRTRREHEAAVRTVSRSLRSGGKWLIDYVNVHHAEEHFIPQADRTIEGTTYHTRNWHDESHFYTSIKISDPSLKEPLEVIEKKAKLSLGDFTDMLSFHDMQVMEVFGDYEFGSYDVKHSPRMIILAEKRGGQPADKDKRLYSDGRTTDALT